MSIITEIEKYKVMREDTISGVDIPGYYILIQDKDWEKIKKRCHFDT